MPIDNNLAAAARRNLSEYEFGEAHVNLALFRNLIDEYEAQGNPVGTGPTAAIDAAYIELDAEALADTWPDAVELVGAMMAADLAALCMEGGCVYIKGHTIRDGLHSWEPGPFVIQCPECRDGKHRNCDGMTWDNDADGFRPCECPHLDDSRNV